MDTSSTDQPLASAEHSVFIWIILAGILVFSAIVGVVAVKFLTANQLVQTPTGSQSAPTR